MGIFSSKKEGGLMDVITCEKDDYIIWKWSPGGEKSHKESAIRYGSRLFVKPGETAVFIYKRPDGHMLDYLKGPYNDKIQTANFPVLASIVGSAFGGASPFTAEVFFINTKGNVQLEFKTAWVPVADPTRREYKIPVMVQGQMTFSIPDCEQLLSLHAMANLSIKEMEKKIEKTISKDILSILDIDSPERLTFQSVRDLPSKTKAIGDAIQDQLTPRILKLYGLCIEEIDIDEVVLDHSSPAYKNLVRVTEEQALANELKENEMYRTNLEDQQFLGVEAQRNAIRIQQEETQRQQRLQTEGANLTAHQINVQGEVARTAAESLGQLGGGGGFGGGDGFNPAGMMTGMMMGGAVGGSMSNMIGNMTQNMNQPQPPQPPAGAVASYHISINGQQAGPYTLAQLQQMVAAGQLTQSTYMWKAGMGGWEPAMNIQEVCALFAAVPPPPPPGPGVPPTPPPPPAGM